MIESPASNLHRIRIRNGEPAFDDDSVPNVQVNVPLEPDITVPTAHPGRPFLGAPDPLYAVNIFAHPFVAGHPMLGIVSNAFGKVWSQS